VRNLRTLRRNQKTEHSGADFPLSVRQFVQYGVKVTLDNLFRPSQTLKSGEAKRARSRSHLLIPKTCHNQLQKSGFDAVDVLFGPWLGPLRLTH
jgi:hypothetical protein